MRQTAEADLAMDVAEFTGVSQPPGDITRAELFDLYPRVFDVNQRHGWSVWRFTARGWILKLVLNIVFKDWVAMNYSGITFDLSPSDHSISNVKIGGNDEHWWKNYTVATPEGVVKGAFGITGLLRLILKSPHDTQVPVWFSTESQLRRNGPLHAPERTVP
jgi:hypothetical protein